MPLVSLRGGEQERKGNGGNVYLITRTSSRFVDKLCSAPTARAHTRAFEELRQRASEAITISGE